ncbi:MAG TPA: glycosyltransferase family 4 protein [Cytophagaceae bacterium]|nr:glycosyltransferase family 4 protein [Cytophagaceae bacterium]
MEQNNKKQEPWICCHLGARAHYQFARALYSGDILKSLITDVWVRDNFLIKILRNIASSGIVKKLLQRYHPSLSHVKVYSFSLAGIYFEVSNRLQKLSGWNLTIKRNNWFQEKTSQIIKLKYPGQNEILFSFAYTALKPFEYAKSKGWRTVLYQIDPGIEEENIVKLENSNVKNSDWVAAPTKYWEDWQKECSLADRIIVNSEWSKHALLKQNIPGEKIKVIPLAHEPSKESLNFERKYPEYFSKDNPMKILFLGTLTVRKGMRPLMEAINLMKSEPVEFWFVGNQEMQIEENKQVRYFPHVSREDTAEFYKKADVFIFPTLSDGFGLTQLEAFEWKLPVINSRYCGEVVEDGINGIVLPDVSAQSITVALRICLTNPSRLKGFSENTKARLDQYSLKNLSQGLFEIFN